MRRVIGIAVVLGAAAALAFLAAGSGSQKGHELLGPARQRLRPRRGRRRQARRRPRGQDPGVQARPPQLPRARRDQPRPAGLDTLRSDAFCESRPQSLIGEYFLDCQPGVHGKVLTTGATVPVNHTATTIAPDLIQNILRLPERERLRIIINELGAGVAGNGRTSTRPSAARVPALQQTDRVLAILAQQNQVLADLAHNGDTVITALANNHRNVGRWVQTARNTAEASAERRAALAAGFRKLPAFLAELRPAMAALGADRGLADRGTAQPRRDERAAASSFFKLLGPFADASRPALRTLAGARRSAARPSPAPRRRSTCSTSTRRPRRSCPRTCTIILEHLDDP